MPTVKSSSASALWPRSQIAPFLTCGKLSTCLKQGGLVHFCLYQSSPQPVLSPIPCSGLLGKLPIAIGQNCTKEQLNMTNALRVSLCTGLCYLLLALEPGRHHRSHRVTGHTLRLTSRLLLKHSMEVFRDVDRAHMKSSLTAGGKLLCCFRPA